MYGNKPLHHDDLVVYQCKNTVSGGLTQAVNNIPKADLRSGIGKAALQTSNIPFIVLLVFFLILFLCKLLQLLQLDVGRSQLDFCFSQEAGFSRTVRLTFQVFQLHFQCVDFLLCNLPFKAFAGVPAQVNGGLAFRLGTDDAGPYPVGRPYAAAHNCTAAGLHRHFSAAIDGASNNAVRL